MPNFEAKYNSKIIIEIDRTGARAKTGKKQPAKGLIYADKDSDYQARRLSGAIRFFDLRQIKIDDVFETMPYFLQPEVTNVSDAPAYSLITADINALADNYNSAIFAIAPAEMPEKFYRIEKEDTPFEKSIIAAFPVEGDPDFEDNLTELDQWKETGLNLNSEQVTALKIKPFGIYFAAGTEFDFADLSNFKITTANDYAAEAAEFNPARAMDIYLMPTILNISSFPYYYNGEQIGVTFNALRYFRDLFGAMVELAPPELLADFLTWLETSHVSTYASDRVLLDILKEFPNARAYRVKREINTVSDPTVYIYTFESFDVSTVPFSTIYTHPAPTNTATVYNESFTANYGYISAYEKTRLRAIIKKGGQLYYFWDNSF